MPRLVKKDSLLDRLLKHTDAYKGISVLIILSTLGYSNDLYDFSNVVRYTFLAISLVILLVCSMGLSSYAPMNLGVISFLVFIALQGLSILWAANLGEAIFDFSKWVLIIGIIILTYNGIKRHQARTICMLANTAVAIFCLSLVATIPQMVEMDGLSWSSRYGITSFFTHKGTYSMQLFLFLPFLLLRAQLPLKGRWFYWVFVVLVSALILFIMARAVVLACVLCLSTFFLAKKIGWAGKKHVQRTNLVSIAVAVVMGLFIIGGCRVMSQNSVMGPDVPSSVLSTASIWERQGLWKGTYRMIDHRPLTGCGIGNWKIVFPSESVEDVFSMDVLDMAFIRPHNDFLRILSESGYISLFAFLIALSYLIIALMFNGAYSKYESMRANLSLSFIVGIIVFAIFDFPFDRMELVLWSSILFGLGVYSSKDKDYELSRKWTIALAATCLLFVGLGIVRWQSEWNYTRVVYNLPQKKWDKVEYYSRKARSPLCNISSNNDPYAYYTGMAREFQGLSPIEDYRLAVKDSPFHKQSLTDLGRVEYLEGNDTSASVKYLKRAMQISPNYSIAFFTLAEILRKEGRYDEALETLYALDLDRKQQIIDKAIYSYMSPQKAEAFSCFAVNEEKTIMQKLITRILSEQEK